MTHQTIVLIAGATDTFHVADPVPGTVMSRVSIYDMYNHPLYGLHGTLDQLSQWGLTPGQVAGELLLLAAGITLADMRISRSVHAQDRWSREIALWVPVGDLGRWSPHAELLERMLKFLTGDRWSINFRMAPSAGPAFVSPAAQLRTVAPTCVSLFSGGLDSYIGAIDALTDGEKPVFVSHWWDNNASKHQTECIDALRNHFGKDNVLHLRAHVGFGHDVLVASTEENTQRARSFLFFALAALAASSIGETTTVYVPENGLISLNVPLDPLRVGALSTRTTHPYFMASFNALLQGLGMSIQLVNPYGFKTKGEMVAECANQAFLSNTAHITMSCSAEGKHRRHPDPTKRIIGHCGYCVPCLIRRASLQAGFGADATNYWLADLHADQIDSNTAMGTDIRAFQLALRRLELDPSRAALDIHVPGPLPGVQEAQEAYRQVYENGMREVGELLDGVDARPLS